MLLCTIASTVPFLVFMSLEIRINIFFINQRGGGTLIHLYFL